MKYRSLTVLLALAAITATEGGAATFGSRTVNYSVSYRWGFINKTAGSGTVTTSSDADGRFTGRLEGHSIPWGGRIYSIEDELQAVMTPGAPLGLDTERVTMSRGIYYKPEVGQPVAFSYDDPSSYWSTAGGGTLNCSASTREAVSITTDMLSIFYYANSIDFDGLAEGQHVQVPVIEADGARRSISIVYGGEQTVNLGEAEVACYAILFNYDYNGAPSSYPVNCWISKEGRIPVIFSAKLEIGHFEMTARL